MTNFRLLPTNCRRLLITAMRICFICLLVLGVLFSYNVSAQGTNPCGVKAVLTPGNDSVLHTYTTINFESESINATSYAIYINGISFSANTAINLTINPGFTTIMLVASNGSCRDTAVAYYFFSGTYPTATDNESRLYGTLWRDYEMVRLRATPDGGYLVGANKLESYSFNESRIGLLMKTKQEGCVEWSKKISPYSTSVEQMEQAEDGSIFMYSSIIASLSLMKLDNNGNLLWAKQLTTGLGYSDFSIRKICPTSDGGVVIVGSNSDYTRGTIARIDNQGNVVWQRSLLYNPSLSGPLNSVIVKDNYVYTAGNFYNSLISVNDPLFAKLDYNTGQTVWLRKYTSSTGGMALGEMSTDGTDIFLTMTTPTGNDGRKTIAGLLKINTDGQILLSRVYTEAYVQNTLSGPYIPGTPTLSKSGDSYYISLSGAYILNVQPGISYNSKLIRLDGSTLSSIWTEASGGIGAPIYYLNTPAPNDGIMMGGRQTGAGLVPNKFSQMLALKQVDSSGTNENTSCYQYRQLQEDIDIPITNTLVSWTSETVTANFTVDVAVLLDNYYPEMRFSCPDYVDSCSMLAVSGTRSVCNLSQVYTYKSHKNKACGQPTVWKVPGSAELVAQTDSTVSVRFPAFGRYVIYGTNPLSCVPVQDSIIVIAESKTPPLNLGGDREICPQNSLTLRAGPRFFSYEWQDGSTDSLYTVTQPGEYWVMVRDSCDNVLRDTIQVRAAPPIPFNAGIDRVKCNSDTLQLIAPTGFMNYTWSPAYNINTTTASTVIVNPLIDTAYTIMAEATPGCFAYDTIRIKVHHSPLINLGAGVSFCKGDSAAFDAGTGFANYNWSNGQQTQVIKAFTAGQYSVIGTTAEGCRSYDTVQVANVYNLPVPVLDQNPVICEGTSRTLNTGGSYSMYEWSTGSQNPSIVVTGTGQYSVIVTDANGCKGAVSTVINRVQPTPARYLGADTAICSYGTLMLSATRSYNSYNWSTGSNTRSISIRQPGEYWLEVKDEEGCTGKDTVLVKLKDCMQGLYVPSAFTPNGDGLNDEFKPMLFGNVKQYEFTVFNRWGTPIFRTRQLGQGWDGRLKGVLQASDVFIWMVKYQLDGQPPKTEKGSVNLIR